MPVPSWNAKRVVKVAVSIAAVVGALLGGGALVSNVANTTNSTTTNNTTINNTTSNTIDNSTTTTINVGAPHTRESPPAAAPAVRPAAPPPIGSAPEIPPPATPTTPAPLRVKSWAPKRSPEPVQAASKDEAVHMVAIDGSKPSRPPEVMTGRFGEAVELSAQAEVGVAVGAMVALPTGSMSVVATPPGVSFALAPATAEGVAGVVTATGTDGALPRHDPSARVLEPGCGSFVDGVYVGPPPPRPAMECTVEDAAGRTVYHVPAAP